MIKGNKGSRYARKTKSSCGKRKCKDPYYSAAIVPKEFQLQKGILRNRSPSDQPSGCYKEILLEDQGILYWSWWDKVISFTPTETGDLSSQKWKMRKFLMGLVVEKRACWIAFDCVSSQHPSLIDLDDRDGKGFLCRIQWVTGDLSQTTPITSGGVYLSRVPASLHHANMDTLKSLGTPAYVYSVFCAFLLVNQYTLKVRVYPLCPLRASLWER